MKLCFLWYFGRLFNVYHGRVSAMLARRDEKDV